MTRGREFFMSVGAAFALSVTAQAAQSQPASPLKVGDSPNIVSGTPKPARLADGHPNWTGFWTVPGGLLDIYRGPSGVTPIPGQTAGPGNGGMPMTPHTPLKSPYKEQYATFMQKAMAGAVADPVALCLPPGVPRMMVGVYGIEVLQTPGQVTMTSEWQAASRRIWLDEKTHPSPDELDPTYTGHSIGHWEGDVLVVDTVGIRTDVPLDFLGLPHSDKLHVVERFSAPKPGQLVDEVTIDDPGAFEGVWKMQYHYGYRPDLKLEEYVCEENNINVGSKGEAIFPK